MTYSIGIAGAGIGGLATAARLAQQGHDVMILDQFSAPQPVGSGLVIQPVGQRALAECSAWETARSMGNPVRQMLGHEGETQRPVLDVAYDLTDPAQYGLAIHRAALFDTLLDAATAAGARLRADSRVTGRSGQILICADGSRHGPFDLIVDATGAGSPLSPMQTRPLPYGAVWATIDWPDTDLPYHHLSQCYRRADRMVGVLPIGQVPGQMGRKAAIFWSLPRDAHDTWRSNGTKAWQAEATSLWPAFAPFAAQITDPDQMTMARYAHGTLARPYGDGIVHIGDAAHRASPQLGQGANMALLDAVALARAIARHPLADAPRAYALARRWHVMIYQGMSAAFTPQYQSDSRWLPVLRDRLLFPASQIPPIPRILTALVCGTMVPPLGSLA